MPSKTRLLRQCAKRWLAWTTAGAMLICFPALGEDLSLEQAISDALSSNLTLEALQSSVEEAGFQVDDARAEHLPTLSARVTRSEFDGDVLISRFVNPLFPGQTNPFSAATDVQDFDQMRSYSLLLSQTVYAGGAIRSSVAARDVERRIMEAELDLARRDIAYEVTRAYLAVLLADAGAQSGSTRVARSTEALRATELLERQGRARQAEVLAARSRHAADEAALLRYDRERARAVLLLNRLRARAPSIDVTPSATLQTPLVEIETQGLIQRLVQHPRVRKSELSSELAKVMESRARASFKPRIGIEAFYSDIDNETFFEGTDTGVNIDVKIPFLRDIRRGVARRNAARARQAMEESSHRHLLLSLETELNRVLLEKEVTEADLQAAMAHLESERERLRVARADRDAGRLHDAQFLSVEADFADTEERVQRAHYAARVVEAELIRLAGLL